MDACTGIRQKPAERSAAQQRNLKTIVDVIRIPESSLIGHMNWATWHFQDIVFNRLSGRNPFEGAGEAFRPRQREFRERMSEMVIRSHRVKTVKGTVEASDDRATKRVTEVIGIVPPPPPENREDNAG